MRLLWTADQPASLVQRTLAEHEYSSLYSALPPNNEWRIGHRLPVLLDASGCLLTECLRFLYDVGFIRGTTRSIRTLETYAESLRDWLTFAEEGLATIPSSPRFQDSWRQRSHRRHRAAVRSKIVGSQHTGQFSPSFD